MNSEALPVNGQAPEHTPEQQWGPNIIINADDYGYCEERCQGIMELVLQKCISSVSVMVNAPHIESYCQPLISYLKSQQQYLSFTPQQIGDAPHLQACNWIQPSQHLLSVGLHLNLTQFNPCFTSHHTAHQNSKDIPSLVFKGKKHFYDNINLLNSNPQFKIFIQAEIRAQIQKFIQLFNNKPTHLDGHNHVHIIPQIAECVCRVARLYGIYKIRLPLSHKLSPMQNQTQNSFNHKFIQLTKQSQKVYDDFGFIYPDNLIGLDIMGSNLTPSAIQNRIRQIRQTSNSTQFFYKFVEIMCHPGYQQKKDFAQFLTCSFSKSSEREDELKILKSSQFRKVIKKLRSYKNLKKDKNEKSVLIYSKLLCGSGNLTTSLRLSKILQQQIGFSVYFMDVPDKNSEGEVLRMKNMIYDLGIKLVIGMNLTRTASVINKAVTFSDKSGIAYRIPYILIVAGTDANITLQQNPSSSKLQAINEGIKNSECLISLSKQMKQFVDQYLKKLNIQKDVILIKQSTLNSQPKSLNTGQLKNINDVKQNRDANSINNKQSRPYIIFPTSFRKVKAVHHVLNELNYLIQKHQIDVYIVGPIINKQYYDSTKQLLKNVQYLGCLPFQQYAKMLQGAHALINCSESEGMSCSILEGFASKIPVIARKNQGNCELIINGVNGFIYENGQEFISIYQALAKDYDQIKQRICHSAYDKLTKQFSYEQEILEYKTMLNNYFEDLTYTLPIHSQQLSSVLLMSLKNIHGISPINLLIFQKFYIQKLGNAQCSNYFLEPILQKQNCINILDVGCGNGIFSIYFLINFMKYHKSKNPTKFNLYFLDVDKNCLSNVKVNLRVLEQICANPFNTNCIIQSTTLLVSDMFQQLQLSEMKNIKFDIIFANMPQTPFNNSQSRIDKNGGKDGLRLTNILISNYGKYLKNKNSFLMMLYSYMNDSKKFANLVQKSDSKIVWKSSAQVHKISIQNYQKMEEGLAESIKQKMLLGRADIELKQQIFHVPADLRIIQPII